MIKTKPLWKIHKHQHQRPKRKAPLTICIAAAANQGHMAVTASDMMLSMPTMKAESGTMKFRKIGQWVVMFAGETGDADLVMDELTGGLLAITSVDQLKEAVIGAYNKRFGEFSAGRWLAPFGLDMPTFLRDGSKSFSQPTFNNLCQQIAEDANNFTLQILLCGWIPGDFGARIYTMDRDGFHSHGIQGFAAIGSGQEAAITSLMFQSYTQHSTHPRVIAQVCIAKFMAEYTDGVGRTTIVWVISHDDKYQFFVQPYEVERIRDFWTKAGMPRYAEGITEFIGEMIKDRWEYATQHLRSTSQKSEDQQ